MSEGPEPEPDQRPGGMRFQDENTTPREPTLAERKAREQAQKRAAEEQQRTDEEAARKKKVRKRVMIGAGVTVGLAAVVGVGYLISSSGDETARCTDDEGVIVDDANCVTPAAANSNYSSGSGYHGGGLYPIFIGGGGRQYHYTYGGSGNLGQRVSGGTTVVPKDTTRVKTYTSGRTISGGSSSASSSSNSGPSLGSNNSGSSTRGGLGSSSGGSSSGS